jgi:hypothetical protein
VDWEKTYELKGKLTHGKSEDHIQPTTVLGKNFALAKQ